MKCSKCQSEMIQAKGSWLCMECGHLETVPASSVPIFSADTKSEPVAEPVAEPIHQVDPVEEAKVEPVDETKTPVEEKTVVEDGPVDVEADLQPMTKVHHTIDHVMQAQDAKVMAPEQGVAEISTVNPASESVTEAPVAESIVEEPAKKPKAKRKPKAKPVPKPAEITSEAAPAIKTIDGPSRPSAPSASELHPLAVVAAPKLETITAPITTPIAAPALVEVQPEPNVTPVAPEEAKPVAPLEPIAPTSLNIVAPAPEQAPPLAEAPIQTIAQDLPAPKADIKSVTPTTHPKPVNATPVINAVTIIVGAAAAAGIIYAYFHGFDIITAFIKK